MATAAWSCRTWAGESQWPWNSQHQGENWARDAFFCSAKVDDSGQEIPWQRCSEAAEKNPLAVPLSHFSSLSKPANFEMQMNLRHTLWFSQELAGNDKNKLELMGA